MKYHVKRFIAGIAFFSFLLSCNNTSTNSAPNKDSTQVGDTTAATYDTTFKVEADTFADRCPALIN
jgi:hypothetical protein